MGNTPESEGEIGNYSSVYTGFGGITPVSTLVFEELLQCLHYPPTKDKVFRAAIGNWVGVMGS